MGGTVATVPPASFVKINENNACAFAAACYSKHIEAAPHAASRKILREPTPEDSQKKL
jgi:hypothetical protein